MNRVRRFIYRAIFKRTTTWIGAILIAGVVIESTSTSLVDRFWMWVNKGVKIIFLDHEPKISNNNNNHNGQHLSECIYCFSSSETLARCKKALR
jgi:hypothetical protein